MRQGIILLAFFLTSCSDYVEELSGDYFFRGEGEPINDILCHCSDQREIPSNVIRYNYDRDFIIAEQIPNKIDDPLYTKTNYKHGQEKTYYWLIIHSNKLVLGPMDKDEYDHALAENKVPVDLKLKKPE